MVTQVDRWASGACTPGVTKNAIAAVQEPMRFSIGTNRHLSSCRDRRISSLPRDAARPPLSNRCANAQRLKI
jgi:hypothetical protein